jgi:hypothetical protein
MSVVDTIAGLSTVNAGSPFDNLPVVNLAAVQQRGSVIKSDLVFIHSVSVLNFPKGDYNFDGKVDASDYIVWKNNFGSKTAAEADGNGNGVVDDADYTVWRDTLGQMSGPGSGAASAAPEPGAWLLVLTGLPALWLVKRRIMRANSRV